MMDRYGLIGKTLSHSYSGEIHKMMGNDAYQLFSLSETEAERFLTEKNFSGINVTIPYKKLAFRLCDAVSEKAKRIGSVNTVLNRNGKLYGYNTDYDGFWGMLDRAGIRLGGKKVLIFGAGGTSLTARAVAEDAGAASISVNYRGDTPAYDSEILLQTTPVGMFPHNAEMPASAEDYPFCEGVADVIYNPLRTRFLESFGKIPKTGGLSMLALQAYYSASLFGTASGTAEELIGKCEKRYRNIVLIGMPGCGKTTVGKKLAGILNIPFADTDTEVYKKVGKTPAEIIAKSGEEAFRDMEEEASARLGTETGRVIACGGGTFTRENNIRNLRQNGIIIYIKRPLSALATDKRPLSRDLARLYEMRAPIFERECDFSLDAERTAEKTAEKIKKELEK